MVAIAHQKAINDTANVALSLNKSNFTGFQFRL